MADTPIVDGVVLVHGGTCAADIWDEVRPLLPFSHVAVDLPGRGANPADLATVTIDDCVAAVLDAADAAGFDEIALVGHSMGGITITETAMRHPDRVKSVVYLAALVPTPERSAAHLVLGADMPGDVMTKMPEEQSRPLFGNDLDDDGWASVAARLVEAMLPALGDDVVRRTIASGHMVMNSQPDTLATVLAEVIRTR